MPDGRRKKGTRAYARLPRMRDDAGDFVPVWEALARRALLPAATSRAMLQGMCGGAARTTAAIVSYADIFHWLIPGLRAFGIEAELMPLPKERDECLHWLKQASGSGGIPLFAFSGSTLPPITDPEAEEAAELPSLTKKGSAQQEEEPTVLSQMLFTRDTVDESRRSAPTAFASLPGSDIFDSEESVSYSHAMLLRQSAKGVRSEHVRRALRRWVTFRAAYPERVFDHNEIDTPLRELAAEFFLELAGEKRDFVSNRLRFAAGMLGEYTMQEDLHEVFLLLSEIVLRDFHLTPSASRFLLDFEYAPTELQVRELIYLARAGTRELKILSIDRLQVEWYSPESFDKEIRATIRQLRYDPDLWVRAAARAAVSANTV